MKNLVIAFALIFMTAPALADEYRGRSKQRDAPNSGGSAVLISGNIFCDDGGALFQILGLVGLPGEPIPLQLDKRVPFACGRLNVAEILSAPTCAIVDFSSPPDFGFTFVCSGPERKVIMKVGEAAKAVLRLE